VFCRATVIAAVLTAQTIPAIPLTAYRQSATSPSLSAAAASCSDAAGRLATPRPPVLLWNCEIQALLYREWADYRADRGSPRTVGGNFMKLQVELADGGHDAMSAAVVYQASGDRRYAQTAYTIAYPNVSTHTPSEDDNFYREILLRYSVLYAWASTGWTDEQRANFLAGLKSLAQDAVHTRGQPDYPRLEDSDQQVGIYFGFWALHQITGGGDPEVEQLWNNPKVGGLDATAADVSSTSRNALKKFIGEMARGGEWIESTEYNPGTTLILLLGYAAMKITLQQDHFPEMMPFLERYALRYVYFATPGLTNAYEWGDNENLRDFRTGLEWTYPASEIEALTKGTPSGGYIQGFLLDVVGKYGYGIEVNSKANISPYAIAMGYDPNLPRAEKTSLPRTFYADGMGILAYRDGWANTDAAWFAHLMNTTTFVDHQPPYFGDFVLWRNGEWAFTHPVGYAGAGLFADGTNTIGFVNFPFWMSSMPEFKKITAEESGTGPDYVYVAGTTGGAAGLVTRGGFFTPPNFVHEWTRSLVALPSADKRSFTTVVFDRTHAQDPRTLKDFWMWENLYTKAAVGATVGKATKIVEQWWHMPVRPNCADATCTWATPRNHLELDTLLPKTISRQVVDENVLATDSRWNSPGVTTPERKYQVRISGASESPFQTWLTVVRAHDGLELPAPRLIEGSDQIQGAVIATPQQHDTVVLFNATPGDPIPTPYADANASTLEHVRWRRSGFSVTWNGFTAQSDVWIFDLDPARTWHCRIDDGTDTPCNVSPAGVARKTGVVGSGPHTLSVTVN